MTQQFQPFTIDVRFTRETGPHPLTYHPAGYVKSVTYAGEYVEIAYRGPEVFTIQMKNYTGPWWYVMNGPGEIMTKFLPPVKPSEEYTTFRFVYDGVWYVLEYRVVA